MDRHRPAHHGGDPAAHGTRDRPGHPWGGTGRPGHRLPRGLRRAARRGGRRPSPSRLQEPDPRRVHRGRQGPPGHHVRQRQGRRPRPLPARFPPRRLRRGGQGLRLGRMTPSVPRRVRKHSLMRTHDGTTPTEEPLCTPSPSETARPVSPGCP
ncbi:hypothetical protein SGPA1_20245 [Streptomyces misionensis JCM 4497]